jgi:ABC-type tungstate transport system substrate-binding protein
MKCVSEAASHMSSAANKTEIAIAVAAGFVLVAIAIAVVIVLARKKGMAAKRGMF